MSSSLDPASVPCGTSFIQHTFVNTRFCLKEFGINLWTKETQNPLTSWRSREKTRNQGDK